MKKKAVRVGIIGFGTVGTGTAKILLENRAILAQRLGFDLELTRISDLDIKTDRGLSLPKGTLTADAAEVLDASDIDIVVELIGGTTTAKDFTLRALGNSKHVVTANKALIATHGNELFSMAAANSVSIGFEASVAGGIPIIKVLREGLIANNILSVYGIINGTANYILSKMSDEGVEFSETLMEAQRLGYAEADPLFDIDGTDSAHKLAILAHLAFGMPLCLDNIYKEGITEITPEDIEFAAELGYRIKLLAIAKSTGKGVELRVHPTMLPKGHLISKVDGVFNAVYVEGDAVGETMYYGRGAGDMPTGSAVVADIAEIAKIIMHSQNWPATPGLGKGSPPVVSIKDVLSMYYFRFAAIDKPGVLSKISGILGGNNISIASVIQKGRKVGEAVPLVVLTHMAREEDILRAIAEIDKLPVVGDKTKFIRVEG